MFPVAVMLSFFQSCDSHAARGCTLPRALVRSAPLVADPIVQMLDVLQEQYARDPGDLSLVAQEECELRSPAILNHSNCIGAVA